MNATDQIKHITPNSETPLKTAAIIVAAGRGSRAGAKTPKQWCLVAGQRVADWTLAAFQKHPRVDHIVVVYHPDDRVHVHTFSGVELVEGGASRDVSVRNGLLALKDRSFDQVLIHDVARPCVAQSVITAVLDALRDNQGAAPAVAVSDALWMAEGDRVAKAVPRNGLYRAQTPQGFRYDAILAAHMSAPDGAADDVEVARHAGIDVAIVPGHENNLKITTPQDFDRAAGLLRADMDIRLGNGYDVHRFCDGDHVILCGVKIPHERGLLGHSDADVGMHAVTDAIYGALADGDIGQHFPPSDPQWKGAASEIFLKHAVKLAGDRGFKIANIDCTLVCEFPKIGPHVKAMRTKMAEIMQLDVDRVSVKATTSERLGFTGRGEGISAMATASLISI